MAQKRGMGRAESDEHTKVKPIGDTHFLGIGINAYTHWPVLHNAVRDVEAIATLLVDHYGIASTTLLLNEAATRKNILAELERLANNLTAPDSLIIYYAGHGHLNNRKRGFWVPVDATQRGIDQFVANSTIRDYIGDIPSLHTLLLSDACFSGSLFVRGERGGKLPLQELTTLASRWAICSGRHDEVVTDGPKNEHSPFAQSILDVLGKSEREVITANFLYEQVRLQTRANYTQLPDGGPLQGVGHKRGEYVFVKTLDESVQDIACQRFVEPKKVQPQNNSLSSTRPFKTESTSSRVNNAYTEITKSMVRVKKGTFMMGCQHERDINCFSSEKPVHSVAIRTFYISKYQVTQAGWRAVMGSDPEGLHNQGCDKCPVEGVNWKDVQMFLEKLNDITGQNYRLPTEAEWEYAARGGRNSNNYTYSGSNNHNEVAWCWDKIKGSIPQSRRKTHPVGRKKANELGLYDMSGNLWEWCEDYWHKNYEGAPQYGSAWLENGDNTYRVVRGGSFEYFNWCRVSSREKKAIYSRNRYTGFRIARD